MGPFDTEEEALEDARDGIDVDERSTPSRRSPAPYRRISRLATGVSLLWTPRRPPHPRFGRLLSTARGGVRYPHQAGRPDMASAPLPEVSICTAQKVIAQAESARRFP
jgi:hypothetical protein